MYFKFAGYRLRLSQCRHVCNCHVAKNILQVVFEGGSVCSPLKDIFFFEIEWTNELHEVSNFIHPSSEYFQTECVGMLTFSRAVLQWIISYPVKPKAKENVCTSRVLV